MVDQRVFVVILAGGASSRFWPRIGDEHPKFLLRMADGQSLLGMAYHRAQTLALRENILVVCGKAQASAVAQELGIAEENLAVEPGRRDTMAACALGSALAESRNRDAIVVTMPADSLMQPETAMASPLTEAVQLNAFEDGRLFSFGIRPTRPETGFGYLELGETLGEDTHVAKRFVEKPDLATAESFLKSGNYLWNSGAFAWRAKDFLAELGRQHAGAAEAARECAAHLGHADKAGAAYERIPKKSVDFGVMEGSRSIGVLSVNAEFDDVGTWDALDRLHALKGADSTLMESSTNCVAVGEGTTAFVGCENLIVVREGERVLVMKKGQGHDVKAITKAWQERG